MAHALEVNGRLPGNRGPDLEPLDALFRQAVLGQ